MGSVSPHVGSVGSVFFVNEHSQHILESIAVEDIWGIGPRLSVRLKNLGIHTALALQKSSQQWIRQHFNVMVARTALELQGISCFAFGESPERKKQIRVSRSFGERVTTLSGLKQAVAKYVASAGEKLRFEKSMAQGLLVFIRTSPFMTGAAFYQKSCAIPIYPATQHTPILLTLALKGLTSIFKPGYRYQKAGVLLFDLIPEDSTTGDLFIDNAHTEKDKRLMSVLDAINDRMGSGTLFYAREGIHTSWGMRSDLRTRPFTTSWDDLPIVLAK